MEPRRHEDKNGEEGVRETLRLAPNIVLMDVNMPLLDGLAATARIMAEKPTPILLMTASENLKNEVDLGLRALEIGALDLVSKPEAIQVADKGAQALLTRLKLLAGVPVISHPRGLSKRAKRPEKTARAGSSIIHRARRVIGVVASTGGPRALKTFLGGLSGELDAAIVIVQHIDGAFLEGLVRWLGDDRPFPVVVGEDGRGIHEGEVIVAPGLCHMEVAIDRSP
ncbi:response regulator [bacterium]|nr:response regulator [bacterium]